MTIAIVDYGAGNLTSVKKALDSLGETAVITSDLEQVSHADKLIVPGVGHFAATGTLNASGLRQVIEAAVARGTPLLGICLGMQWMFAASTEAPDLAGLGLFPGDCTHFPPEVKAPHVGWNELALVGPSRLLRDIPQKAFVYFTHSYRVPVVEQTVATCEYGGRFSAVVEQDRVFGVQFHPEKSGLVGKKLLENFCGLSC
ncbi:MAG: imidazole glycerol phosphate synthase subunit HisH [Terriglobales bacterium]